MSWYVDTSAFVKLVVEEAESAALQRWVADREAEGPLVSSDLLRTEALRAARRIGDQAVVGRTLALLSGLVLVRLTPATFLAAGHLDPPWLRSLDALHLAAAEALGDDLEGVVAYDERLLAAADAVGVPTATPR